MGYNDRFGVCYAENTFIAPNRIFKEYALLIRLARNAPNVLAGNVLCILFHLNKPAIHNKCITHPIACILVKRSARKCFLTDPGYPVTDTNACQLCAIGERSFTKRIHTVRNHDVFKTAPFKCLIPDIGHAVGDINIRQAAASFKRRPSNRVQCLRKHDLLQAFAA